MRFRNPLRLSICAVGLTLFAAAASAGIGPQQTIPAPQPAGWAVSYHAAFDGASYVLAYATDTGIRVARISEAGELLGAPISISDPAARLPAIGSNGKGLSLVGWVVPPPDGRPLGAVQMAWLDANGLPGPTFTFGQAVAPLAIASVGGKFLVAWSDASGVHVATLEPRATSYTRSERIAAGVYPYVRSIVVNGSRAVLAWDNHEFFGCAIPEGCTRPILRVDLLDADGTLRQMGEPADVTGTPLPPVSDDVFVLNAPAAVVRVGAAGAEVWSIRGGAGAALLAGQIYFTRIRSLYGGMRDVYFGAATPGAPLDGEYRYTHTQLTNAVVPSPLLTAGTHTLLAISGAVTDQSYPGNAVAYAIIDPAAPFPPLAQPPEALSVAPFIASPARPSGWQTTIRWPVVAGVAHYFVEIEPLSDPSASYFIGPVPGTTGEGIVDSFDSDVLYAIRVYAETRDGMSRPAESLVRTPPRTTPRSAVDFAVTALAGDRATFRWRDVSSNESGFRIVVCTTQSLCRPIAQTGPDSTSVTATLLPGWYSYSLETFNAAGSIFADRHVSILVAVPRRRASR